MTANNIYSVDATNASVFTAANSGKSVIVKATANAFYLDNLYVGKGVNIFVSGKKSDSSEVTDSTLEKALISICSYDGICIAVDGFIKNETNYYSMAKTGKTGNAKIDDSSSTKFGTGCSTPSDDGGKILADGSLCLGKEAIPFISDGKTGFYITYDSSAFKFVRAIKNVFTKEEFDSTKGKI